MISLSKETTIELLNAMDDFKFLAQILIEKLISETNQPEKDKINEGHYYEIENADLYNGNDTLSENWYFDVHGEHCLFQNTITGQYLEVSLGDKESIRNLDPYFFYQFLKTTADLSPLTEHFKSPFNDMFSFFEVLKNENKLIHIYGNEFRKL